MRRLLALVFLVYLLGLGRVTLGPASTPSRAVEKTAAQVDRATQPGGASPQSTTRDRSVVDTAFNVLLFVPFGALVLGLWPSWRWWAVIGAGGALSVAIELSQRWFFTWRSEQLSDVITNILGTAIGWAVAAAA
ncbi:MAG: VanZ family protein, partial [Actinobacteria bacterium]|nr:VanZ family protein [Actinomycetota bacterium]